ncbi:MAG: membrane dipeptidase [Ignavibacterium sp.]|nr:MAG: membrane dipeptidase [Ignavibacterium sp.]
MISRRKFIHSSTLAGAGLLSGLSFSSLTGCSSANPCIEPVTKHKYVLADIHNHPTLTDWIWNSPIAVKIPMAADIAKGFFDKTGTSWQTSHAAGIDLICVSHFNLFDEWVTMATDPNPAAPTNALRMINLLEKELEGPAAQYTKLIRTPEDFNNHFNNNYNKNEPSYRIAVLHSLEGGHALGGSLEPLNKFAQRGVVIITIGHFFNKGIATAPNAIPFFPDANSLRPHQGLSHFGRDVIYEMEKLGILVDVTHATSTAFEDILKVSTKPLIATHITAKTLGDHAYSFYDEYIKEIVHRGGMIGIPLYTYMLANYINVQEVEKYGSLREVVRTIRYVIKITNSYKNICIGSDFGGYIPHLIDMNSLCEIEKLRVLLLKEFGSEEIVEDILAKNVIEFVRNNWKRNV